MGLFKRLVNKASRWVRRKRDHLIDESEKLLDDIRQDPRRLNLLWKTIRPHLVAWGIAEAQDMLGRELFKELPFLMERLEPRQRSWIRDAISDAKHAAL